MDKYQWTASKMRTLGGRAWTWLPCRKWRKHAWVLLQVVLMKQQSCEGPAHAAKFGAPSPRKIFNFGVLSVPCCKWSVHTRSLLWLSTPAGGRALKGPSPPPNLQSGLLVLPSSCSASPSKHSHPRQPDVDVYEKLHALSQHRAPLVT